MEIKVVPKVWGEEHWIVNKEYCGKKLILKKGYRCSMHYHKKKDETFYVIKGKVLMELGTEKSSEISGASLTSFGGMKKWVMNVNDSLHIPPGTKHRFTGLENSEIIEFSTHHEDEDSYRVTQSERIGEEEFEDMTKEYC